MGKSVYSVSGFDEMRCVDAYTLLWGLPKFQLPPRSSSRSRQSNGIPAARKFLAAARPEDPAPMMQNLSAVEGVTVIQRSFAVIPRSAIQSFRGQVLSF